MGRVISQTILLKKKTIAFKPIWNTFSWLNNSENCEVKTRHSLDCGSHCPHHSCRLIHRASRSGYMRTTSVYRTLILSVKSTVAELYPPTAASVTPNYLPAVYIESSPIDLLQRKVVKSVGVKLLSSFCQSQVKVISTPKTQDCTFLK